MQSKFYCQISLQKIKLNLFYFSSYQVFLISKQDTGSTKWWKGSYQVLGGFTLVAINSFKRQSWLQTRTDNWLICHLKMCIILTLCTNGNSNNFQFSFQGICTWIIDWTIVPRCNIDICGLYTFPENFLG